MKNKQVYLSSVSVAIVSIFSFVAFTKPINATATIVTEETTWIDNFDSGTLNSRWTWVRENPTYWSLTANPGYLRIITSGSLHQSNNNLENLLLTPIAVEDFQLITQVTFSPAENYLSAGLIVYQDDDNYIEMTRVFSDGNKVRIKQEIGGVTSSQAVDVTATTLYLRIDKYGDDYYGFYSLDGDVWEFVGQNNMNFTNTYAGLAAENGPTVTEINADFDYFEFIPLTYNKTWEDDFSSETLNSAWSWINEDPTHWSLTDNPGFMHITTQNGSLGFGGYHNFLVTDSPYGDYQITSRAIISPTENFQSANIVVYGDAGNFVRVGRRFGGSGDEINLRQYGNDTIVENISVSETATSVYLRLTKIGNNYSGYYSLDGNSYKYIGQITATYTNPKVGIISENGPSTTEIPTDYDFFRLVTNMRTLYLPLVTR